MRAATVFGIAALCATAPLGGRAGAMTEQDLRQVAIDPPVGARLDAARPAIDSAGRSTTFAAAAAGRAAVFVFADYRCRYLCGPALSLTADALSRSGLKPGRDYRLIVLGLDPRDRPADAAAFGAARLSAYPDIERSTRLLVADPATIAGAARALGYRYRYDAAHDQFAHMAAAFVLTPDGRLVQTLSNFQLQPAALKAALRGAARGDRPPLLTRLHALCWPFDPDRGVYNRPVQTALQLGSGGLAALGLVAFWRIRRRRTP